MCRRIRKFSLRQCYLFLGVALLGIMAVMPTAAQAQLHGNGLVKACTGPQGDNLVLVGETANFTIQAVNLDTAGHAIRIDSIVDCVHHAAPVGDECTANLLAAPVTLTNLGDTTQVSHSDVVEATDVNNPDISGDGFPDFSDTANSAGVDLGTSLAVTASAEHLCEIVECRVDADCAPVQGECGVAVCVENRCEVTFAPATTICRPGSGDACDPDESCTGDSADCPADIISPATTICRPGSGDICDPAESCTGVAGEACPADTVAPATTICNPGSGDICDPAESCTGVPGATCPADTIAPATTICNPGSGDICDPAESCTGVADQACPADTIAPATTICRPGSGDICDPAESCTGVADQACPADTVAPATTICNPGSGDICDPAESCTGVPGATCPADTIAPATTICRPAVDTQCDIAESCTGTADQACPTDQFQPESTTCEADEDVCTIDHCNATGQCVFLEDSTAPECVGEAICRTPGFWGTHPAITQAVINEVGSLNVCGECLNATDANNASSAIEAICVSPSGDQRLQLARQLTAAALNCVISGFGADCGGSASLANLLAECNTECFDGSSPFSVTDCITLVDAFNNGVSDLAEGCHDRDLCNEDLGLCFDPPGPADPRVCQAVNGSTNKGKKPDQCTVIEPLEATCATQGICPAP